MIDSVSGLFYEEYGPADAASLVFLHGGGIAGWMWRYQVDFFKAGYHCLVPDLPEQGQSGAVGPFSVEFAAEKIAEFIRSRAHGARAHVVGLSEGAQVVVALLSRHAGVIDHALVSSAILRPMPGQWMYNEGLFKWSYRWFMAPFKKNEGWIRLNMHSSAGVGDEFFADFKRSFQETSESGFTHVMVGAMHFRLPPNLEKAEVPVLVTAGQHEYPAMRQSARDLLAVLPQACGGLVSLGKGSALAKEHNWAMTAPALFNETLAAWLNEGRLPQGLLPLACPESR